MTDAPEEEQPLPEMPSSYRDWLKKQNEKLDGENFAPSASLRKWQIAAETPLKFFVAVAAQAASAGTADYLRRQGRKAVKGADGVVVFKKPQQMTLIDITIFLINNYDRRNADAVSERVTVVEWVESHHGYTVADVYKLAGVPVPAGDVTVPAGGDDA